MVYLNQAGTSWPKPGPVRTAVADALAAPPDTWAERLEREHRAVARALGAPDPSRLLITPGCTSALAVAVADLPWETGDRVLTSGREHHALHRPVRQLAARGVEAGVVAPAGSRALDLEDLERELRRGGVRLVATTAACNVTGELLPVREIAALAHEHGALALVDAAQVAGWLPVHVEELGADLVAFAGHKALHGPWGVGALWVAPHVVTATPAATCELPPAGAPSTAPSACAAVPGPCDVGSIDRAALAGLAAGIAWLAEPERADRLLLARGLAARLAHGARELGATLHGPAWDDEGVQDRLPTVALTVAGRASGELAAALAERGVAVSGGLQCAPLAHATLGTAPDGVLRLSVGPGNDEADVERALEALGAVLAAS